MGDRTARVAGARNRPRRHSVKIPAVPIAKASWLTVVALCAIAVVLLAIGGYTGYSIVVGAVGLAAAVNLI